MIPTRSVLIVDRSEETQEVLRVALERRGLRTLSATQAGRGLELARQHHPDLIVLDLEADESNGVTICERFAHHSLGGGTHLVMLGRLCGQSPPLECGEYVSKPYHYGPLIRRIERLLDGIEQGPARAT